MVKKGPLVKIEGALDAETARLLREVDGIEVAVREPRARRGGDITVRFAGVARPVDVELKQYLNAATAWQLVRHAEGAGDRYLLVVTDQATDEARGILERHGIGTVDGAGNAHMELPGLLLHIEGKRRTKEPRKQGAIRLSGKAGLVAQALLLERDRVWQINDLAGEAAVSDALVHRVLARLEAEGLVAIEGTGPARVRRVVNATALLDLWAEENVDRAVERTTVFRLARTPKELVAVVAERLGKVDITYAVTRAAAAMALAPFVTSVPTVDAWIQSTITPKEVVKALDAELVETGANLVLSQTPGDAPLAFRREHEGTWLVNPVRLYYDLRKDPRRGREQADRLRQEVIGF
jgi:DNA-binding transcriptional regulator YhcF (GntR family)